MGSIAACCRTCRCPQPKDTGKGRREILNSDEAYYMKEHKSFLPSSTIKITTEYVCKPNGDLLFTKLFEPKDPSLARGMILYSIGFGNHLEWRMHDIGCNYAQRGFIVFMCSFKGHGRSDGEYMFINEFETDFTDEAIWIFNYAISKYIKPHKIYVNTIDKYNNYFLVGASFGGAITCSVALKQQNQLKNPYKGMVLVGPLLGIAESDKPPQCVICCMVNCCLPCCPHCSLIPYGVTNETLTTNEELQGFLDKNPILPNNRLPLSSGYNLLKIGLDLESKGAKEIAMPFFIAHGDNDQVVNYQISENFYNNADNVDEKDKEIKIYPNLGHVMYFEDESVFNDCTKWMMSRIENFSPDDDQKEDK